MRRQLIADVMTAVEEPRTPSSGSHGEPVFPLLIGAAAGLLTARSLLLSGNGKMRRPKRDSDEVDLSSLGRDFLQAIEHDQNDHRLWTHTQSLRTWSVGFFLNKAQANLALALDKSVNVWLKVSLEKDLGDKRAARVRLIENRVLAASVATRLLLLRPLVGETVRGKIDELLDAFERFGSADAAATALEEYRSNVGRGKGAKYVDEIYADLKFVRHEAAAIVVGRVELFENFFRRPERKGVEFPLEVAISARALRDISQFWKAMLHDTRSDG